MRWMKLEAQPSVPHFYFLLFILNKIKINNFLSVISLSMQYKNTSKIKVLQMPWKLNMIFFLEYLRIYGTKNTPGGQPPCHEGGGCAPLPHGPTVDLLHLFFQPHTSSSSPKHEKPAQTRVQARFAAIFDLLAQSTSHKTAWGDCSLVCDSSIGPISFCSSDLFIANFCCIGDPVLELAC